MAELMLPNHDNSIPGYKLKEGNFLTAHASDDELWAALCGTFSTKAVHDTSYKYAFMKSILDNLYNVDADYRLSFDQLFGKFAEIYWNLILKYSIRQKAKTKGDRRSYIERILLDVKEQYSLPDGVPFESLTEDIRQGVCYSVKQKCKNNVVGALYGDTAQLFYGFSIKNQVLELNPAMYEFLCKHKVFVEKVNYFEWASFLDKINDDECTLHLLQKLDESAKRNNLSPYRQILYNEFEQQRCFYCGRSINIDNAHVDHFVPWSFIKDDKLWNFVLACPECNLHKKDKLPVVPYLDLVEDRNEDIARRGERFGMDNFQPERLRNVYGWAQRNGYDELWRPKRSFLYVQEQGVKIVAEK